MGLAALALCAFLVYLAVTSPVVEHTFIVIGICASAVPFFFALYQSMKLLGYIEHNTAFSDASVVALRKIKYCAAAFSMIYILGMPYIFYVAEQDDAPGVVLIGLVLVAAPIVIAVFAALLQQLLQNAIDIKSENDLTV